MTCSGNAWAEVSGLLRRVGASGGRDSVRLISCDAQAYEAQRVLDVRAVRLLGGGGTDMGAGLAAAVDLRPGPDVVIVLTDGHTPWPASAPVGCDVVVALLDAQGSAPDWATTVVVDVPGVGGPEGERRGRDGGAPLASAQRFSAASGSGNSPPVWLRYGCAPG